MSYGRLLGFRVKVDMWARGSIKCRGQKERLLRELTPRAILLGLILAVVFGAANAYLGLKAGMTVSASIPAAVVSTAILRGLLKRGNILENNIVQTIASAGESLAAGVIFTVPALILLGLSPSIFYIFLLSLTGGILGILFLVPFRKHLIEEEHENLPYPEGTACAEVLQAGEEGGKKAAFVFSGLGVGALFKFLTSGMKLWEGVPSLFVGGLRTLLGVDLSPALLGVGYILGLRIASLVLSGGLLGWFGLIPLVSFLKGIPVNSIDDVYGIWSHYIRYIGAGAVLAGGVVSFFRGTPTFFRALRSLRIERSGETRDLPMRYVVFGVFIVFVLLVFVPLFRIGAMGALFTLLFALLFVAVSARIVGIVGSSSNPVSGMTIATLLVVSFIFARTGLRGERGMVAALTLGAVVCIAACIAGDTSQDLKTGFLVGATPWKQQVTEFLGVGVSALFVGWTLFLLHKAYVIGSPGLSAPQATLMSLVVKGVMEGTMPWYLVGTGVFIALSIELLGIHSLPVAVGLYLPLELSTPIFLGGILASFGGKRENGILYASGLVAGDALVGILIALLIVLGVHIPALRTPSKSLAVAALLVLALSVLYVAGKFRKKY